MSGALPAVTHAVTNASAGRDASALGVRTGADTPLVPAPPGFIDSHAASPLHRHAEAHPPADGTQRSSAARLGVDAINIASWASTGLVFGRLLAARKGAFAAGNGKRWIGELIAQNPTIDTVPYKTGGWRLAYDSQNAIASVLGLVTLGAGLVNLKDGIDQQGSGFLGSRSGRTGLVQTIAGAFSVGVTIAAAASGRGGGLKGMAEASIHAPMRGSLWASVIAMGVQQLFWMNEVGSFDFANRGNQRSFGTVELDSLKAIPHNLPMILFG